MPAASKRTFSLTDEQSKYIDSKVNSGTYGSASEVVRAGLRTLQERDEVIERWLIEEVVPTYDEIIADPHRSKSLDEVLASLEAHHEERVKKYEVFRSTGRGCGRGSQDHLRPYCEYSSEATALNTFEEFLNYAVLSQHFLSVARSVTICGMVYAS